MKTLSLIAVLLFAFAANSFSQSLATATIKVWGNCGMCKETIEASAMKAGASTASWNEDSKELKVSYASGKTSTDKIQKKIAKSGYDTQDFVAPDKAYNALHGCCKYERKATPTEKIKSAPLN
jgi:mercuric ion binding protein